KMAEPKRLHSIEFLDHEDLLDKECLSVISKTQVEKMWLVARLLNIHGRPRGFLLLLINFTFMIKEVLI
ncbi:hypothetical protein, partial [Halomonas llamarensis]